MDKEKGSPRVGIIGSGVGGLCQAIQLQKKLGHTNYTIWEQDSSLGGTWNINTYPGLSCDIPGVFYSFSFDPYPGETFFPPQKEILAYLRRTSDTHGVTPHIVFNTFFAAARWDDEANNWKLTLKDVRTNESREETVDVLILAIGGLVVPNECNIRGAKDFQGPLFHSARWRHDISLKDKNVIVIGNGCSASQIIPAVIDETKSITQFIRTPQWYLKTNNFKYPGWAKWVLKWIPGMLFFWRFFIYILLDLTFILLTKDYTSWRLKVEDALRRKMLAAAPKKYHDILLPTYSAGCKRRILDPDFIYLKSLHSPKMTLTKTPLTQITKDAVIDANGTRYPADVIVLANGFLIGGHIAKLNIKGRNGQDLLEYWGQKEAVSCYRSVLVSEFPNFFLIDGPNSASGHFSVIYSVECQVDYTCKLLAPIIMKKARAIMVRSEAEEGDVKYITGKQCNMVWHKDVGGCTSWYYDSKSGRNDLLFPDFQTKLYLRLLYPIWKDFRIKRNDGKWVDELRTSWLGKWF